jgi:hypothetical protein
VSLSDVISPNESTVNTQQNQITGLYDPVTVTTTPLIADSMAFPTEKGINLIPEPVADDPRT